MGRVGFLDRAVALCAGLQDVQTVNGREMSTLHAAVELADAKSVEAAPLIDKLIKALLVQQPVTHAEPAGRPVSGEGRRAALLEAMCDGVTPLFRYASAVAA